MNPAIKNILMVSFLSLASASTVAQAAAPFPPGRMVDQVVCQSDPDESYALYLPSGYTATKRWPIIYAFDPFARGKGPVKLFQEAAEKYGYIVVGSNNSRNFSLEAASKAANAVWQDTHLRFSIDERQVYTTGLSGGARVAGMVALRCAACKIAGVIAQGAGYPTVGQPPEKDSLQYLFTVGGEDFNWPEIIQIRRQREAQGLSYRVLVFAGTHQWAPKDVVDEAVQWIHLKAMQSGAQPRDQVFVEEFFARMKNEAAGAEKQNDPIAQLSAYRCLVSDFGGLENVGEYAQNLAALKQSAALQKALKQEQQQIAEQTSITSDLSSKFASFGESPTDQRQAARTDILDGMRLLKSEAEHAKALRRPVFLRAFNDLSAQGIEAGQAEFERRHFDVAESYFQLMSEISPDEAWPTLLLAETHSSTGNKKQAIKDIRETVRRGLKNPDVLEQDRNLVALRNDPDFVKIVAELKSK
jgi:hypothetical protein